VASRADTKPLATRSDIEDYVVLVQDLQIRVVNAATGELLRELILDPNRDYQPTGAPKGSAQEPSK
jgi:hypothetical protein